MMSKRSRQEILQLVADGHLTADEAAALLTAGGETAGAAGDEGAMPAGKEPQTIEVEEEETGRANGGPTWLRVQVSDGRSGKNRVTVNVPLNMVRLGLKIGRRFVPEIESVDWNEMDALLHQAGRGVLVEVIDETDGEHVRVVLD